MHEEWKDVFGYEGLYQVSNFGNVKSIRKYHRKGVVFKIREIRKKLWNDKKKGYVSVNLNKNGKSKTTWVHKLVAIAFVKNVENKPQINHKNGIKHDNNWDNLEWVTPRENMLHLHRVLNYKMPQWQIDKIKKSVSGENNKSAILTEKIVLEIRERLKNGEKQISLANEFGVKYATISLIKLRKTWKHI